MALTFAQLFAPKQVNNAAPDTLFTVPASPAAGLLRNARIRFANTTAAPITLKAWAVQPAGAAADSNMFHPDDTIGAKKYIDVDVPLMVAGGFVQAQAGAVGITATILDGFIQS